MKRQTHAIAMMSMTEAKLQNEIRLALGRDPDLVIWRNQAGVGDFGGRMARCGLVEGASDLIGILAPSGRFIALEIKTSTGRVSDAQRRFIDLVNARGGYGAVVRSVEEAMAAIRAARSAE